MQNAIRWIAADTETTGLRQPKVCELAWAELDDDGQVIDTKYSLIDPQAPIEPGASGVHGIVNSMVEDAPTMDEFFHVCHDEHPLDGDVVLICHNVPFDKPLLAPYIPNMVGTICTLRLARKIYTEADNHKLNTLRDYLDLDAGEAHRADGDVTMLVSLVQRLMQDTGLDLYGLMDLCSEPIAVKKMTFGKHKGVALKDVPKGWFEWYVKQEQTDPDLVASIRKIHPNL